MLHVINCYRRAALIAVITAAIAPQAAKAESDPPSLRLPVIVAPSLPNEPPPPVVSSLSTGRALVSQLGTQWSIAPINGVTDVIGFYSYGAPNASAANTGLETFSASEIFLYQDTSRTPAPLSLVCINDAVGNVAGGAANFTVSGLPLISNYAVQDDTFDSYAPFPPVGGVTTAGLSWGTCCTDGYAIDGLDSEPFCLQVLPQFLGGIRQWQLMDGPDLATSTRTTLPSMTDTLYICGDCLSLTCPGLIEGACDSPTGGFVDVRIQGLSLCGGEIMTNDRTAGGADASDNYPMGSTDVTFTLVDAGGFTTSCTTTVVVADTEPPIITCPAPLTLDCTGASGVPVTDPRIQAWLASFTAVDACSGETLSDDAPAFYPANCSPNRTLITFRAVDGLGQESTCTSTITVHAQCLALPLDVGPALRVGNHGDPHAADITARFDWSLDAGLPRPADEHYHLRRGLSPQGLSLIPGTEPWTPLSMDESTPAGTTSPFVHYYLVVAAGPCDDLSLD